MSNKSIAKNILQKYAGDDRKGVESMLVSAAKMARAEEAARVEKVIRTHRELLKLAFDRIAANEKVARLKLASGIKALDATIDVLYEPEQ